VSSPVLTAEDALRNAGHDVSKGVTSIALSRRISNPDGSFAGIAVIAVNLHYFRDLLAASLRAGRDIRRHPVA